MRTLDRLTVLLLVAAFTTGGAFAQGYPNKPIHLRAAGAGTTGDVAARLIAPEISAALGQPVVVENLVPINLFTGVSKADPDGYTLMVAGGSLWLSTILSKVPYAPQDYSPIALLTRSPFLLVVNSAVPAKSVAELVKLAKAKPGSLNYSSGSNGSASHIAAELFKSLAGVDVVRVAYKATPQQTTDLLAGQIHMTFANAGAFDSHIRAGKLRYLATAGAQRSAQYPDLPTVAETVPGYSSEGLIAFFAPARTPQAIIGRLNQETNRALQKSEVKDRLLKISLEPAGGTPEQAAAVIKSDLSVVGKMIADGSIKVGEE